MLEGSLGVRGVCGWKLWLEGYVVGLIGVKEYVMGVKQYMFKGRY